MTTISSIVGNGEQGYSGDGGPATAATMDNPFHVEFDPSYRWLYIADCFNYAIRRLDMQSGEVTTFAGTGESGHTGDGGPATEAKIDEIYAIQVDGNGDVYILQRFNPSIRKIDITTGTISTVAGDTTVGFSGDGGPATEAQMREPNDCILDGKGGLLIADVQDQRIRRLDIASGTMSTFAGTGEKEHTGMVARLARRAYSARALFAWTAAETLMCASVRAIRCGASTRTALSPGSRARERRVIQEMADRRSIVSSTAEGDTLRRGRNVLIVDTENHAIRKYHADSGIITTVAGGHEGPDGDGGAAVGAGLARPHGVVVDGDGAMYIADSENHRIRLVR